MLFSIHRCWQWPWAKDEVYCHLHSGPDEKDSDAGEGKVQNGINLEASQADAFPETGADSDEIRQEEGRL